MLSATVPRASDEPRPRRRPRAAREATILAHRYLCRRGARRFLRAGLEWDDLEQVAAIGLVKATDRYDPGAQTPFEAFAWMMIVGELGHHVRDHEHLVRAPRDLRALERRHARAWERLAQRLDREPTDAELSSELRASLAVVRELRAVRACGQPVDIDDPSVAPELERSADAARRGRLAHDDALTLRTAFARLPAAERRVLYAIYWLDLSRTETARRMDCTAKVVGRLQRNALARLRTLCAVAPACGAR